MAAPHADQSPSTDLHLQSLGAGPPGLRLFVHAEHQELGHPARLQNPAAQPRAKPSCSQRGCRTEGCRVLAPRSPPAPARVPQASAASRRWGTQALWLWQPQGKCCISRLLCSGCCHGCSLPPIEPTAAYAHLPLHLTESAHQRQWWVGR